MSLCWSNMIELPIYSSLSIQTPHQTTTHVDCIILLTRTADIREICYCTISFCNNLPPLSVSYIYLRSLRTNWTIRWIIGLTQIVVQSNAGQCIHLSIYYRCLYKSQNSCWMPKQVSMLSLSCYAHLFGYGYINQVLSDITSSPY